jgi:hypothetical protein
MSGEKRAEPVRRQAFLPLSCGSVPQRLTWSQDRRLVNGAQWRPAGLVEAAISRQRGEYVRHGLVTKLERARHRRGHRRVGGRLTMDTDHTTPTEAEIAAAVK